MINICFAYPIDSRFYDHFFPFNKGVSQIVSETVNNVIMFGDFSVNKILACKS